MDSLRILTASQQVAEHLRGELLRWKWIETMPGVGRLARGLGVGKDTVEAALRQLEAEGLLVGRGKRRKRQIVLQEEPARPTLRVAILRHEPMALSPDYMVELHHLLTAAGHAAFFTAKCLLELRMNVPRIARMVEKTAADAWIVAAGSREVLGWFVARGLPTMALFGRRRGLPIAGVGPDKTQAVAAATRRLVELGHHRIVMLARRLRRLPVPGGSERAFLAELRAHGIVTGPYNLPDWAEASEGLNRTMASLFGATPPTAMIIEEAPLFAAVQQFLLHQGLRVPQDVSLVCTDGDPHFAWCQPSVAHIRWDSHPVIHRIVRWAANVSHGRRDVRQTLTKAEFVEGGTIGRAKG